MIDEVPDDPFEQAMAAVRATLGTAAQQLQALQAVEFSAEAAGGQVRAVARGTRLRAVEIDPGLRDHVALGAAVTEAVRAALAGARESIVAAARSGGAA